MASDETPAGGALAPSVEHRSILLDLNHLRHPSFDVDGHVVVNEIAPETDCPGSVVHTYEGLHSVAVRRVMGYYRRLFAEELRDRWDKGSDSLDSIERRLQRMAWAESDLQSGGRWWERSWRQSLTPQAGGAPATARIVEVGKELELIRIGELALTNEGKLKVGRLSLYLDDDRIYERIEHRTRDALFSQGRARSEANLSRVVASDKEKAERPQKTVLAEESRLDVSVGLLEDDAALELERVLAGTSRERQRRGGAFKTPRGNLLTGEGWNMSFRPNLQLRLPDGAAMHTAISRAEVVVDLRLYPGETRQLWGVLTLRVAASPRDNFGFSGMVTLEVVRW